MCERQVSKCCFKSAYSEWREVRFAVNMTAVGSVCSHRESVTTAQLDGSIGQHEEESPLLIGSRLQFFQKL